MRCPYSAVRAGSALLLRPPASAAASVCPLLAVLTHCPRSPLPSSVPAASTAPRLCPFRRAFHATAPALLALPSPVSRAHTTVVAAAAATAAAPKLAPPTPSATFAASSLPPPPPPESEPEDGFGRSDKAEKAAVVNLSARLSSREDPPPSKAGFADIVRLFKLARREAWPLTGAFVLLCLTSGLSLAVPFSIGKILDVATGSSIGDTIFGMTLTQFYGVLGVVFVVGSVANFGRVTILRIVGERLVARLRSQLYRQTVLQDAEFFDANRVGDLISRLSSDANIVAKSLTQNVSDGLRAIVSGVAGVSMMAYVSIQLTGVMLLIVPPVAIFAFVYGRRIRNVARETQKALGTATKVAEERLSNIKTAQSFSGEIQEVHRYNERVREIFDLGKREALYSAMFFSLTRFSGDLTILAILAAGSQMVTSNTITIGELSSFMMYAAYTGGSMFGLSSFYAELMKGVGAASRLFELEDRKPKIKITQGRPVPNNAQGMIEFRDVAFAYPTRPAATIFDGLSFSVQPGKNVCIVGPSGSGKSTISQLLLRFYDPLRGQITIDGEDIRQFNLKSLRRAIGAVSQEPVLFSGSIAENIAYGKTDVTRADIVTAAKRANCGFIEDFPDGLDTQVGPRGAQLSGGQKQRIAIARALIRNPSILILDEATSALDAESESAVNEALVRLMQSNTTTISIAHRLSTIMRSDYIIVMNSNGQVEEQGTFRELCSNPDTFFSKLLLDNQYTVDDADADQQKKEDEEVLKEELLEELVHEQEKAKTADRMEENPLVP
ncbi:P-loop containing nucleoside triphosphate hydrolase protein [Limtongia smithiae]|uniref:P-loop containing nucleoside triphosphate hydrolase protein n=1 Tax=Limtongia smithiae TaxID=1125753 RepID=UPI0034CFD2AE